MLLKVMDPSKLFAGPLNLGRKFGLSLNYKKEEILLKFFAVWCYVNLILSLVFRFNYLISSHYDIEDLSGLISNILGNIETILKVFTFYIYRREYTLLINEIVRKFEQGEVKFICETFSMRFFRFQAHG